MSKKNAKKERVSAQNVACPTILSQQPFVREPIWQKNERRKKRSYVLLINNAPKCQIGNVKLGCGLHKLQMEFQDLSNIHIYFFCCGVFILRLFRINYMHRGSSDSTNFVLPGNHTNEKS